MAARWFGWGQAAAERDADRQLVLEALSVVRDATVALANAQQAQALVQKAWLESFQAAGQGESSVVTFEDELQRQTQRDLDVLQKAGYPGGGSAVDQDQWLQSFMSQPL